MMIVVRVYRWARAAGRVRERESRVSSADPSTRISVSRAAPQRKYDGPKARGPSACVEKPVFFFFFDFSILV